MDKCYDLKMKFLKNKSFHCENCRKKLPYLFNELVKCCPLHERALGRKRLKFSLTGSKIFPHFVFFLHP